MRQATPTAPKCRTCGGRHYPATNGAGVSLECGTSRPLHGTASDPYPLPDPVRSSAAARDFARGLRESLDTVTPLGYPYGCGVVDGASGSVEYPSPFRAERLAAYSAGFIQGTALRRAWGAR